MASGDDIDAERKHRIEYYKTVQDPHTRTVMRQDEDGNEYPVEETYYTTRSVLDEERTKEEIEGAGLFGKHIGYQASMADNPDPDAGEAGVLQDPGSGELGRLMVQYMYWSVKEGKGWSEANKPVYEKDLWDDRGSWFQAPTIRGVAEIGVSVAAVALSGGTALPALLGAAAINLADDAVFGLLDGIGGYKQWEEVGLDFGKKLAVSAVNVAGGQASSTALDGTYRAATGLMAKTGFGGVVARTMWSGVQTATTSIASSAINAINCQYDKDGNVKGHGWSGDAFNSGVQGGIISAASGFASGIVGGGLGQLNLFDGNSLSLTDRAFNTASIQRFNGLMGGLAGSAVNYAFTGDFNLNVLNAADLSGGGLHGGLLEMHMGKNGFSMNVGSGGADVSLGAIAASLSGFVDTTKIAGARIGSAFGSYKGISDLNAVNMLGYSNNAFNIALAKGIWSDDIQTRYEEVNDDYGYFNQSSPDVIVLSEALLGTGKDKAVMLAAVLAHEGTHLAGNRVEGIAHQQAYGTYGTLTGMFGIRADSDFVGGMEYAMSLKESWEENTGEVDHWRVLLDGSLNDDGSGDISFEDGRATIKTGQGRQSSLESWLRGNNSGFNAFSSLMKGSGYKGDLSNWNEKRGFGLSCGWADKNL